jgi:enterochelin esterase family protein
LPDGSNPPASADGNFILGATHTVPADEGVRGSTIPQGTVIEFAMKSSDSKIYPGITRAANTFGSVDPADPAKLIVTTGHPAPYTRKVAVYVPKQYVAGRSRL